MSKFKVGDEVVFVKYDQERDDEKEKGFNAGGVYKISRISGPHVRIENELGFIYVDNFQIKSSCEYKNSNRSKLREHVKSLGFSAIDLSVAAGFNKAYFGSETSESRFNSRGDISDDRLLELKHKAFEAKKKISDELWGRIINKDCKDSKDKQFNIAADVRKTTSLDFGDELISESIEKINNVTKIKKHKSKWIVSNKVFLTFVFFFVLLTLLALTGIVKQVF